MRKKNPSLIRMLSALFLLAGMMGMLSSSATAAPGNSMDSESASLFQTEGEGTPESEDTGEGEEDEDTTDETPTAVDSDGDGIPDADDNCPDVSNVDQLDLDDDGIGRACDTDDSPIDFGDDDGAEGEGSEDDATGTPEGEGNGTGDEGEGDGTEDEGDLGTPEGGEGDEEEEGEFGIFAISPGDTMGPDDSLSIGFPEGATFGDLDVVSVNLSNILEDTCQQGSPRFAFGLDSDGDGGTDNHVPAYIANYPGFTGCSESPYATGQNLVGTTEARWDTSAFGGGYVTWADAVGLVGDYAVTEVLFVVEYGQVTVTPADVIVTFDTPSGPGTLFGTVIVNTTFGGDLPVDESCYTLTDDLDEEVSEPLCITGSDLDGRVGSVVFENLTAGNYTVTQSTVPTNFSGNEPVSVEVTEGYDETVSMTNEVLQTTLTVSSAYPEILNVVPGGTTVTAFFDGNGPITDDDDPWFPEDTTLPHVETAEMSVFTPSPWRVIVDAEGFHPYDQTFEVEPGGSYDIVLVPESAVSDVTIEIASIAPNIDNSVSAGTTWTILQGDTELDSGTIAQSLILPQTVDLTGVDYGTYTVEVDAGAEFFPYTADFTINQPTQTVDVLLVPTAATSNVTINITSTSPDDADIVPAGTEWSVSQGGVVLDSGTLEEELPLPEAIELTDVPYGNYTITVEPADTFRDYSAEFTVDEPTESFDVELTPQSLVDRIIAILIEILQDILAEQGTT